MCGRFSNAQTVPQYRSAVRQQLPRPERHPPTPAPDADDYYPTHNVAPQTRVPVVRRELANEKAARLANKSTDSDEQEQAIIQTMKWGLIPRFHKTPPSYGEAYKTINARDDTILSSQRSLWHPLLASQRCVVFVQGFYEWQKKTLGGPVDSEKIDRVPHFVGMKETGSGREDSHGHSKRLMALAGLYEKVHFDGEKEPLYTFTIVTTSSNDQLGFLHDRMPVILPTADDIGTWLGLGKAGTKDNSDDTWTPEVAKLLRPSSLELDCYKVPREVGKVGNSDPSFILPIEERKDGLRAFLAKQHTPAKPSIADLADDDKDSIESSEPLDPNAALEVTEDAEMVEIAARAEREQEDHELALRLDREMNGEAQNTQVDEVDGHDIGDGFAIPDQPASTEPHASSITDDTAADTPLEPSSRFSPDPFNPPLSPPRPKGGYSRKLPTSAGGGIHVTPARNRNNRNKPSRPFPQAAPHTWKNTITSPSKTTTQIDSVFAYTQEPLSAISAARHTTPPPQAAAVAQQSRTPKRARVKSNDSTSSPASKGQDIRSFFSPKKL